MLFRGLMWLSLPNVSLQFPSHTNVDVLVMCSYRFQFIKDVSAFFESSLCFSAKMNVHLSHPILYLKQIERKCFSMETVLVGLLSHATFFDETKSSIGECHWQCFDLPSPATIGLESVNLSPRLLFLK